MRADRRATIAAAVAVVATAGAALCAFLVAPSPRWILVGVFLPALWTFVELAQVRGDEATGRSIMTVHRCVIAWAGLLLCSRLGVQLAHHAGLLGDAWLPAQRRFGGLALGVGLILFGNYLPTLQSPWSLVEQPFAWQQVHRFVGWVLALSGLAIFACWAVLGVDAAKGATVGIMSAAMVVALGRKLASVIAHA